MHYKVQEMMFESNANEEATDKWAVELDEKLEKMEQPMADLEDAIKGEINMKSIEEKNQKTPKDLRGEFQKKSRLWR